MFSPTTRMVQATDSQEHRAGEGCVRILVAHPDLRWMRLLVSSCAKAERLILGVPHSERPCYGPKLVRDVGANVVSRVIP